MDKLLKALPGGKSVTGGVALLLMGVAGLVLRLAMPESEFNLQPETALAAIAAGWAALGLAGKAQRNLDDAAVTKTKTETIQSDLQAIIKELKVK